MRTMNNTVLCNIEAMNKEKFFPFKCHETLNIGKSFFSLKVNNKLEFGLQQVIK